MNRILSVGKNPTAQCVASSYIPGALCGGNQAMNAAAQFPYKFSICWAGRELSDLVSSPVMVDTVAHTYSLVLRKQR